MLRNEHWIWFQYNTTKIQSLQLEKQVAPRFEIYWKSVHEPTDLNPRLRYLVGIDFSMNSKSLYFAAYNEFFFDVFSGRIITFSENWAFVGIGFNLSPKTKLETGPLVISWIRNTEKDAELFFYIPLKSGLFTFFDFFVSDFFPFSYGLTCVKLSFRKQKI